MKPYHKLIHCALICSYYLVTGICHAQGKTTEESIKAMQVMRQKYNRDHPNGGTGKVREQIALETEAIIAQWAKSDSVDGLLEILELSSEQADLYDGSANLYYGHKSTNQEKGDTLAKWILGTSSLDERRKAVFRTLNEYALGSPLLRQVLAEFLDDRTEYQYPPPIIPHDGGWPVRNWAHNALNYCAEQYGLTKGDKGASLLVYYSTPSVEDERISLLKQRLASNPDLFPKVADVKGVAGSTKTDP